MYMSTGMVILDAVAPFEEWLRQYGYLAVFVGAILEGETGLIPAAFAAHRGYLSIAGVIGAAFFGSTLTGYAYFWLGRFAGQRWLASRPNLLKRSQRVQRLIERYPTGILLSYHFLYGLRAIIPLVYGMGRISAVQFTLLATLSTFLWAVVMGLAGYFFGEVAQQVFEKVAQHEQTILLGLLLVALVIGLIVRFELLNWLKSRFSTRRPT
jgi:membrane protein DedA with SNARE-associated domain